MTPPTPQRVVTDSTTRTSAKLRRLVIALTLVITATMTMAIAAAWTVPARADTVTYCHKDGTCGWPTPDDANGNVANDESGDTEVVPIIFRTHAECLNYFAKNYGHLLGEIESINCEERNGRFVLRIIWHKRKPDVPDSKPLSGTKNPACGVTVIPPAPPVLGGPGVIQLPAPQSVTC